MRRTFNNLNFVVSGSKGLFLLCKKKKKDTNTLNNPLKPMSQWKTPDHQSP
jgi:hypothetical protein